MEIRIESLIDGARRASGAVVVIDVFRAYTTAAVLFSKGAAEIVLVAQPPEALALRAAGLVDLCMGEVGGKKPEGFDFGNSPFELSQMSGEDLRGKKIVQSTRAGTVGACAVAPGVDLFAGALVIARATTAALRDLGAPLTTLVAMGAGGVVRGDEDELCALYMRSLLEGREGGDPGEAAIATLARRGHDGMRFGSPEEPWMHVEDMDIALDVDRFDFAIRVTREGELLVARPYPPIAAHGKPE